MSEWIKWDGGRCPVEPHDPTDIRVEHQPGVTEDRLWDDLDQAARDRGPGGWRWSRAHDVSNIVAYRPHPTTEDFLILALLELKP